MAESPLKRFREEGEVEDSKKHKSYSQIISLLEGDVEDETTQDLSSLITTLQQEISSELDPVHEALNPENYNFTTVDFSFSATEDLDSSSSPSPSPSNPSKSEDDEDRVMKHLLEASDDELGIPNTVAGAGEVGGAGGVNGGEDDYPLWELEDDAAAYYTLLQSELFM